MHPCRICGHPCKTIQGLRGHGQLAHPGEISDSGAGDTPDGQGEEISAVSDPGPPARRTPGAELEQRFILTLDRLDEVLPAIEGLRERIGQIEGSLGEDGELMDRLGNLDLTVSAVLDRMEESDDDPESEGEVEAAEEELLGDPAFETPPKPQRGLLAWAFGYDSDEEMDQDLTKGNPLLFPPRE